MRNIRVAPPHERIGHRTSNASPPSEDRLKDWVATLGPLGLIMIMLLVTPLTQAGSQHTPGNSASAKEASGAARGSPLGHKAAVSTSTPSPEATQAPALTATELASPQATVVPTPPPATPSPTILAAPSSQPAPAPVSYSSSGFVTRQGATLYLDGGPYRFTGMNIFNANSRGTCGETMGGAHLSDSLTAAGSGQNVIRAWFFQSFVTVSGQRDWTAFDETLASASAHGVKVIATLADQWPYCEAPSGYKSDAWYAGGYSAAVPSGWTVPYRSFVEEVATRYRDDPTILAWQLMNEAEAKAAQDGACPANAAALLKSWASDVAGLIKAVDPNHLVSLGSMGVGNCGMSNVEYAWVHDLPAIDLCEYHDYGAVTAAIPGDSWNGLAVRLAQCAALGKPVFVGEIGMQPNEAGLAGTLQDRADRLRLKFEGQFGAGVVGELIWSWSRLGSSLSDFNVGPGDPALNLLSEY